MQDSIRFAYLYYKLNVFRCWNPFCFWRDKNLQSKTKTFDDFKKIRRSIESLFRNTSVDLLSTHLWTFISNYTNSLANTGVANTCDINRAGVLDLLIMDNTIFPINNHDSTFFKRPKISKTRHNKNYQNSEADFTMRRKKNVAKSKPKVNKNTKNKLISDQWKPNKQNGIPALLEKNVGISRHEARQMVDIENKNKPEKNPRKGNSVLGTQCSFLLFCTSFYYISRFILFH